MPDDATNSSRVPFIVTIDTEGDNVWAKPKVATDKNAACLPRFQTLCERYGLRPTYLVDHTMATSPAFQEFGRDVLARDAGEIGMHLHAWDTPPLVSLSGRDHEVLPFLTLYPDDVMRQKIVYQTELLEQTFETRMLSHRAGRFGFDQRYARILADLGYLVDSSVTPHVDWMATPPGGPDFSRFPETAYWTNLGDLSSADGASSLLEVPVTVRNRWPAWLKWPRVPRPCGQTVRDWLFLRCGGRGSLFGRRGVDP